MVQENYPRFVSGHQGGNSRDGKLAKNSLNITELLALTDAAESISVSDIVDNVIHSTQEWSLLPVHGVYSTVSPTLKISNLPRGQAIFSR